MDLNSLSDIKIGSNDISKIYKGSNVIWEKVVFPDSGLIHYFSFDDNYGDYTYDKVGNAYGVSSLPDLYISGFKGLCFDGWLNNQYILFTGLNGLGSQLGNITFNFWWLSTTHWGGHILSVVNDGNTTALQIFPTDTGQIGFSIRSENGQLFRVLTTNGGYNDENWHNITISFQSSAFGEKSFKIGVDGISVPTIITHNGNPLTFVDFQYNPALGSYNGGTPQWFSKSYIDELSIWDRMITDDEINLIYNNGNGLFFTPQSDLYMVSVNDNGYNILNNDIIIHTIDDISNTYRDNTFNFPKLYILDSNDITTIDVLTGNKINVYNEHDISTTINTNMTIDIIEDVAGGNYLTIYDMVHNDIFMTSFEVLNNNTLQIYDYFSYFIGTTIREMVSDKEYIYAYRTGANNNRRIYKIKYNYQDHYIEENVSNAIIPLGTNSPNFFNVSNNYILIHSVLYEVILLDKTDLSIIFNVNDSIISLNSFCDDGDFIYTINNNVIFKRETDFQIVNSTASNGATDIYVNGDILYLTFPDGTYRKMYKNNLQWVGGYIQLTGNSREMYFK